MIQPVAEPIKPSQKRRFTGLDGLRGVAALVVIWLHTGAPPLPRSYLAVDFFFALSGFVLAHGYEGRLKSGMAPAEFMLRRYIRLWPLYILALVLGAAVALSGAPGHVPFIASVAFGALLLPTPVEALSADRTRAFPLVGPAWSLFSELVANLVFALVARHLRAAALAGLLALGAGLLVFVRLSLGDLDVGSSVSHLWAGPARVIWSFFAGVAVYRLWLRYRPPELPIVVCAVALLVMFSLPYELAWVLAGFPLVIYLGASSEPRGPLAALCEWLGLASYGAYVLHKPLIEALRAAGVHTDGPPVALAICLVATLIALILDRVYDQPVRRWLERRLTPRGRKTAPTATVHPLAETGAAPGRPISRA